MRLTVVRLFAAFLLTLAATSAIFAADLTSTVAAVTGHRHSSRLVTGGVHRLRTRTAGVNLLSDGELLRRRGRMGIRPHLRRQLVVAT